MIARLRMAIQILRGEFPDCNALGRPHLTFQGWNATGTCMSCGVETGGRS